MFCKKCGNQIKEGSLFCTKCGTKITPVQPQPTPPVQNVVPPVAQRPTPPVAQRPVPPMNGSVPPVPPQNRNFVAAVPEKPKKSKLPLIIILSVIAIALLGVGLFFLLKPSNSNGGNNTTYRPNATNTPYVRITSEPTKYVEPEVTSTPKPTKTPKPTTAPVSTEKTRTLMVYMVGSDLESKAGFGTNQINEMLAAKSSPNVNIVIEAGGTTNWHNSLFTNNEVQRAVIKNNKIEVVEKLGKKSMADKDTLADFIKWAKKYCPADEYDIVLFNHGGSASNGYGLDEVYTGDYMLLDEMENAFKAAGVKFGFIGFDACLMADFETAYIFRNYADYLVASESVEYSLSGWNYEAFLSKMATDNNATTKDICKAIVDGTKNEYESYINGTHKNSSKVGKLDFWTYSISTIDLKEIDTLYDDFCKFMVDFRAELEKGERTPYIGNVVYHSKYFGGKPTDLIDMESCFSRFKSINISSYAPVVKDIKKVVIYNETNIPESCGLGFYLPYYNVMNFEKTINSIGKYMDDKNYLAAMIEWASIVAYNTGEWKNLTWYRQDIAEKCMQYVKDFSINGKTPFVRDANGVYSWKIEEKDGWQLAALSEKLYLNIDGKLYSFGERDATTGTGDTLHASFDGKWYTINNTFVQIINQGREKTLDGQDYTYSFIPAVIERGGKKVKINLVVVLDYGKREGNVVGFNERNESYNTMNQITTYQFEMGDKVSLCYQVVNNNAVPQKEEILQVLFTYDGSKITVNEGVVPKDMVYYYKACVYDYFGKTYESPYITNKK